MLVSYAFAHALPERFAEHVVRGSDLGESRILAGMHSPVDVIGARIEALAVVSYVLNTEQGAADAEAAHEAAQSYFGALAAEADMSLYDYAHRTVEAGGFIDGENVNIDVFNNNFYEDHDAIKALYAECMTYGLPQDGNAAGQDPIVPLGAEALLRIRHPYLSDAQRRAVLHTTEVDSGYPILDKSNGWGRVNLVDAADGYGAFPGDVEVTMNADDGGFSALDWWRNDISGEGMLTKAGSGQSGDSFCVLARASDTDGMEVAALNREPRPVMCCRSGLRPSWSLASSTHLAPTSSNSVSRKRFSGLRSRSRADILPLPDMGTR